MQLTLSGCRINPQIGASTLDLFCCFDRLWHQLYPAVTPLPIVFPVPCVGSGVTQSCFSCWWLCACWGLGGSDTSVCQPRSRIAVECSGPGGHNWGCSCPEHGVRSPCLCCGSRTVLAKSGTQPQLPSLWGLWQVCSSSTIPLALGSREMSQVFVAPEPLELLTWTVQERFCCPCSCLLLAQCFLALLCVCYQAEIVFLRSYALKFSTELNTESPKASFSRDYGSSKSRQGCASGLAGRLGFPSSLQHELIKLRSVGMNGAWEPDAVLCREVVIT